VTTSATALGDRAATRAWLPGRHHCASRTETVLAGDARSPSRAAQRSDDDQPRRGGLAARTPGIYPVRADYTTPHGVVTARTVLTVPAARRAEP
jgi:hypothetical protein